MARRRWVLLGLTLAAALGAVAPGARAAAPPPHWAGWDLGPGVEHLLTERPGMVANAARIDADASLALRPVVAFDRVGGGHAPHDGRQPVSELCSRVGGMVCINADFFNCGTCGQPAGGLVDRGRPLRSFRPDHEQVSLVGGRLTTDPIWWVGRLSALAGTVAIDLPLASLNRGPMPGGAVIYTPEWGPTTPQVPGQLELVLATGGPLQPGIMHAAPVARRPVSGEIPRDGIVIAANGRAAETLNRLWDAWHATRGPRRLLIDTALSAPAEFSVGGHPFLLKGGARQSLDPADPMVAKRHPRTVLGWTADGDLLLVVIDGRQPGYSNGATLHEATDLLVELGAVDALNLDGGGSATFALRCGHGACVRNRPSGQRERPVPLALAVVPVAPNDPGVFRAAAYAPPPAPIAIEPAPPTPPADEPTAPVAAPQVSTPEAVTLPAPRTRQVGSVPAVQTPVRRTDGPDRTAAVSVGVAAIAGCVALAGWRLRRRPAR